MEDAEPDALARARGFDAFAWRGWLSPASEGWPEGLEARGVATVTLYARGDAEARRAARLAFEDNARAVAESPLEWYGQLVASAIAAGVAWTRSGFAEDAPRSLLLPDLASASVELLDSLASESPGSNSTRAPRGMARTRALAGLLKHHRFDGDWVNNCEPTTPTKLAEECGIKSPQTVSALFAEGWGSHASYVAACSGHPEALRDKLEALGDDYNRARESYGSSTDNL